MKKNIFCFVLFFTTITAAGQTFDNLKNTLISMYTDTFGKTMGENKVYREGNVVYIEDFYYTQGISGINVIDYSLNIDEFDRYLYYVCTNSDYSYIFVTIIKRPLEDKYGNKYPREKITIGQINTEESKLYKSFRHWVKVYNFLSMFNKDLEEYNEKIEWQSRRSSNGVIIRESYFPKSIFIY